MFFWSITLNTLAELFGMARTNLGKQKDPHNEPRWAADVWGGGRGSGRETSTTAQRRGPLLCVADVEIHFDSVRLAKPLNREWRRESSNAVLQFWHL